MRHIVFFIVITLALHSCNNDSRRNKATALSKQSKAAINSKEYLTALNRAKEALDIYKIISDTLGIVESYYHLARASALSDDFENAVIYGETGNKFCKVIKNFPLEYKLNNTLSWAYFTLGKGFYETMEHQKRQLFVVDKLDDDEAKAMVYNNYGYDATVSGSIPLVKAIEYMNFANDYYSNTENNKGRWYTLMNLTWQHRLINDLPKSEKYGRLSVEQAKMDDDRHAIIEANTNLGETLLSQSKIDEAKPFYEDALELSNQKVDRDKYIFDVYYSRYLWETGKKDEAISSLKMAVNFLENREIFYEMLARSFLADYYYSIGDRIKANVQVKKFKNPRASYFSQESSVIACGIEALIVSSTDREKALNILDNKLQELEKSGAELLKLRLLELRERI